MTRPKPLQDFLDALLDAADRRVHDQDARSSLSRIRTAVQKIAEISEGDATRLPVCDQLKDTIAPAAFDAPELRNLVQSFLTLNPTLTWRRRAGDMLHASPNIADNHGNAMILGPGGLERRTDVWLGASLLAPNVRYPDHNHPPEETYLVLSEGEFLQGDGPWFTPGIGGTFYNSPGINHAMRSGNTPLFAFWMLWAGDDHR